MCFYIDKSIQSKIKIAWRPIVCYKRMITYTEIKQVQSLIYNDIATKFGFVKVNYDLNKKYHAADKRGKQIKKLIVNKLDGDVVDEGFHSNITKEFNTSNVECVIPRGAMYFKNQCEYVSTAIIFKKIIGN